MYLGAGQNWIFSVARTIHLRQFLSTKWHGFFFVFTFSWSLSPIASSQKLQLDSPFSTGKYMKVRIGPRISHSSSQFWQRHRAQKVPYGIQNHLTHTCRLHHLFECSIFGIISTPTNSRRGWHGHPFFQGVGLALVAKTCPHRPQAI